MKQKASAYREAAAQGATQIGLLILAYDALARELARAGEAVRRGNIADRCQHSNQAIAILGHLESWTGYLDEPPLAGALNQFYIFLRSRILQLQRENSSAEFDALSQHVIDTRITWQKKEQQHLQAHTGKHSPGPVLGEAALLAGAKATFRVSA
jgi:flagellin-specific chaperone FliS